MLRKLILPLFLLSAVWADRIELMSNGVSNIHYYAEILEKNKIDATIIEADMEKYGKGFQKSRKVLAKLLRKVSLDYPKSIHIEPGLRKIVLMNIPIGYYRDHHVAKLPKDKMILFMWEPYIRLRKMYNPKLHACFSRVYTWDDDLVDNVKYFKFYYPDMRPMIQDVVPFEEKKFCVLVSGHVPNLDKYIRQYPGELYSHRVRAIEFFEKTGEKGFEFYGRNWPGDCYRSYRGPVIDKINVIKNYRFSICYENCRDSVGYLSEKIFDCFAAGNVPVYWGAPNVTDYIPKDCFIDRRDFATLDDLYVFLKTMSKEEYEGYLERIRNYLQSEKAQLYSKEHFEQIFIDAIKA